MKQFRIHRSKRDGNGFAVAWELSYKENEKYDKYQMFLVIAPQEGADENGNAKFSWKEKSITVKLGENDIGEILAVVERRQDAAGNKGSLFHESPSGGNKSITFSKADNGYYLKVSYQDKDKKLTGPYSIVMSNGEASILAALLRVAIISFYQW